jgi:hypothetical protein
MKLSARQIATFAPYSEETLLAWFDSIGSKPEHRAKKTGLVKLTWIRHSDTLLAEVGRRRRARGEDSML